MTLVLDWNAIRPLNGSRADGFEELCAQLARAESPSSSRFERKGTPDAGVECYTVLDDSREWGWQAKYIDNLGDAQWPQLDDSVRTALEKHPRLVRYFICAPLDRPDARISGRRSAMERWDEHVVKWGGWATERGMAVEFVWWGSHELLERLALPQHVGRVYFWFGVRGFDETWFQARLGEALRTAGPRYTPEIHVNLPIAAELETFGRTQRFFDRIKAHARDIRKVLTSFGYSKSKTAERSLDTSVSAVTTKVQAILDKLGAVTFQPVGDLPFRGIATLVAETLVIAEELENSLSDLAREHDGRRAETGKKETSFAYRDNPFKDLLHQLYSLESELRKAQGALEHADVVAGGALMLLTGAAGTGKTHLLCDVAKQRLTEGRPTVLLMGQQFISTEPPWIQATQQLDLTGLSAEKFIGALEAAAQAADCRALVLIDALNEGAGRQIWPSHLAAFLAHLERSAWIGVVLSVRSSYEETVVPADIRACATHVTHHGFADHEYDAAKTFFVHYGLELPSTPLLAPEFHNPLFLKTLCRGLHEKGERRLPRGFHGITSTFDLYLDAINQHLARMLAFNPKHALVRRALNDFAGALVNSGDRWLTLANAEETVNALLPGRGFDQSLYHGLVAEGVLVEESIPGGDSARQEVVFVGYERLADHFVANNLLDAYLNTEDPGAAFAPGGPLAFLWDESQYVPVGLLEAMCIQLPERTGQELVSLAPRLKQKWQAREAFRQSLVWRSAEAVSEGTCKVLGALIRNEHELRQTLDALLTIATLPGHPLNARHLDQRLRRDGMPDRDAWWSSYLHHSWGNHGAVDRLVDWASSVTFDLSLDDESVDLCVITLAWMLTTSNRFLRDRATKALVSLLTGRLGAVVRMTEYFAQVDDPYVAERIYAVAYGVATRSHDREKVGVLAVCVYNQVFVSAPPAQILLRDYARGVVERALYLGAQLDVAIERIRPPYQSQWPHIPTDEEIQTLLPDWSRGAHDSGELEWARNRIGSSVMSDDFARYVIGTNSSSASDRWLSVRLEEAVWKSTDEQLAELVSNFSEEARVAWATFDEADSALRRASFPLALPDWLLEKLAEASNAPGDNTRDEAKLVDQGQQNLPEIDELTNNHERTLDTLKAMLSDDQIAHLDQLLAKRNETCSPPGFELGEIQRYVLWRVFDLGWTIERFGHFDRFDIGYHGRAASKAERIGKKYQWIAYHEILAFIADHYQYREPYRDGGDRSYDGPWQVSLRDIDPTCTLRTTRGGTSWESHAPSWWAPILYENWGEAGDPQGWVMRQDDLPRLEDLLRCINPVDGTRWLNVDGHFSWRQQPPADRELGDAERRDLWHSCTGYLVRAEDADAFKEWADGANFWGHWMPAPETHEMFLGEHCWSSASRHFQQPYFGDHGWSQPDRNCPVRVRAMVTKYANSADGFDSSVDESFTLRLPSCDLMAEMGLRWTGKDADFVDSAGRLTAFDPTASCDGPNALLIREDLLQAFLVRERLSFFWVISGEKRAIGAGFTGERLASIEISGAYTLCDGEPVGFLKFEADPGA